MHASSALNSADTYNGADFHGIFVERAHFLLQIGYSRLNPSEFGRAQEPDITGELAYYIEEFLNEPARSDWIPLFWVLDDPPVNPPRRRRTNGILRGRRRKRVDLRIGSSESSPRRSFCWEAKRLRTPKDADKYVGEDGMGRFIDGRYSAGEPCAGMLGYVQKGELKDWAALISPKIACRSDALTLTSGGMIETAVCRHQRVAPADGAIDIFHSLLIFRAASGTSPKRRARREL